MGRKGNNVYAHELAKAHINSGKQLTIKVLNEILAYSNILVSEETFNSLINMPRMIFNDLHKKETRSLIDDKLGLPHSKTQRQGVYIFTCLDTNQKYVGSSSQLALRLRGYLNKTHKDTGKLIPLIEKKGLACFRLEVICLPYYPEFRPEIVLEQYFLLDPTFNLNTIKVANNPSGSTAKPLYMYNRDKSILYYFTLQQKDFISKLNISHFTFTKHLTKGTSAKAFSGFCGACLPCSIVPYKLFNPRRNRLNKVLGFARLHLNRVTSGNIYMYNRDMSILYYVSSKYDYGNNLKIHYPRKKNRKRFILFR